MVQTPRDLITTLPPPQVRSSLYMKERRYRLFRNLRGWLTSLVGAYILSASQNKLLICGRRVCPVILIALIHVFMSIATTLAVS